MKIKSWIWKIMMLLATGILTIISLVPIIWLYMSSLKSTGELFINRWSWPKRIAWENYTTAWNKGNIDLFFMNSVIVTLASIFAMVFLGALAAFAISKYTQFKSGFYLFLFFLLGQMVPAQIVVITLYLILNKLHLLNSYQGLVLVYVASGLPFVILVLQGFFRGIPRELYEAATIDGYSEGKLFLRIALPMASPAVATTLIIQFKYVWNEFMLALVINSAGQKLTLPVGIYRAAVTQYSTDYGVAFAGISIALLPMMVFYIIFQRFILKGIAAGAVKG